MIYLYAITDHFTTEGRGQRAESVYLPSALYALPSALHGLLDAPVRLLPCDGFAAAVSELSHTIPATPAHVWRHEHVIEACMADAVLPVRFGTIYGNEARLREALVPHAAAFRADLDRVRGCVELGLRVMRKDAGRGMRDANFSSSRIPHPLSLTSGTAYLRARLEAAKRERQAIAEAEAIAEQLHAALAHVAVAHLHRPLAGSRQLLTAAYLVERQHVSAFRDAVTAHALEQPMLRLLLTGPWPPYHFVSAGDQTPR